MNRLVHLARLLQLAALLSGVATCGGGACASDTTGLRSSDSEHVWNFSPRNVMTVSDLPDRALMACCPRNGGDMRIDAIVDGQGHLHDIAITRPPAALGLTMAATCALFDVFLVVGDVAGEPELRNEFSDVTQGCIDAKTHMGGGYLPPAVPGTTKTCVERMASAWSLKDRAARPISVTWECRP